jgi:hypothetical protein
LKTQLIKINFLNGAIDLHLHGCNFVPLENQQKENVMYFRSGLFALAMLCSASGIALSASATPEEAQRITHVLQTYLGAEPGVVGVTPAGDAYDLKIDFAPLLKKLHQPGQTVTITPIAMKLTDNGGGKWLVTQDAPFSFSAKVPGKLELAASVGSIKASSVFDENVGAFISSTSDYTDFTVDETITTPEAGATRVAYSVKSAHYETSATPSSNGTVDGAARWTMAGLIEKISLPASAASPAPVEITVTAETGMSDATIKGTHHKAIYKLLAWFVAHASETAIKENEAELKALLREGLPLFESIANTGSIEKITIASPVGPIGIAKIGFGINMNGIVADGSLQESVSVEGLTLPPGLVPPFAADIVPDKFTLDFKLADFNLADPAKLILDNMSLTKMDAANPELKAKLLAAVMPKGAVTITMGPSNVASKIYDVGMSGNLSVGTSPIPSGNASITAKGFDKVMSALQAMPPEMGMQSAIAGMIAAKGLSKQEADGSMSWKIESTATGGVLVNGIDVTKMGGGG